MPPPPEGVRRRSPSGGDRDPSAGEGVRIGAPNRLRWAALRRALGYDSDPEFAAFLLAMAENETMPPRAESTSKDEQSQEQEEDEGNNESYTSRGNNNNNNNGNEGHQQQQQQRQRQRVLQRERRTLGVEASSARAASSMGEASEEEDQEDEDEEDQDQDQEEEEEEDQEKVKEVKEEEEEEEEAEDGRKMDQGQEEEEVGEVKGVEEVKLGDGPPADQPQDEENDSPSEDEKDFDWTPGGVRCMRRSTRAATLKSKRVGCQTRARARILTLQKPKRKRSASEDIRKAPPDWAAIEEAATTLVPPQPSQTSAFETPSLDDTFAKPVVEKIRTCVDCSQKHPSDACPLYRPLRVILDTPVNPSAAAAVPPQQTQPPTPLSKGGILVMNRAEASLPKMLKLVVLDKTHGPSVVAVEPLEQYTQFGPLIGQGIYEADIHEDSDLKNIWEIFHDNIKLYVDTSDAESSNWLRFLRPSATKSERNVSAVPFADGLYFVTIKDVAAGAELTYWSEDPTVAWSRKKMEKTSCGGCNQKFVNSLYYRMHCMIFHDPNYSLTIRKYHCKICGVAVIGKENIMRHASEMHDGKGAYQCQYCKKFFLRLNYLDMHRTYGCKLNPRRSRPLCDLCGKKFCQPQKLKVHIRRMHSDISEVLKEFQCKSCFKLLGSRAALQRHLKEVHNKDQNIAATCDRCGKTFQNKSNLKIHMLTHSGVKPFRCTESGCTAAFTTKQCLQFHYKKVHGYTIETMPSIERCIAYTFESYSGGQGDEDEDNDNEDMARSIVFENPRSATTVSDPRDDEDEEEDNEDSSSACSSGLSSAFPSKDDILLPPTATPVQGAASPPEGHRDMDSLEALALEPCGHGVAVSEDHAGIIVSEDRGMMDDEQTPQMRGGGENLMREDSHMRGDPHLQMRGDPLMRDESHMRGVVAEEQREMMDDEPLQMRGGGGEHHRVRDDEPQHVHSDPHPQMRGDPLMREELRMRGESNHMRDQQPHMHGGDPHMREEQHLRGENHMRDQQPHIRDELRLRDENNHMREEPHLRDQQPHLRGDPQIREESLMRREMLDARHLHQQQQQQQPLADKRRSPEVEEEDEENALRGHAAEEDSLDERLASSPLAQVDVMSMGAVDPDVVGGGGEPRLGDEDNHADMEPMESSDVDLDTDLDDNMSDQSLELVDPRDDPSPTLMRRGGVLEQHGVLEPDCMPHMSAGSIYGALGGRHLSKDDAVAAKEFASEMVASMACDYALARHYAASLGAPPPQHGDYAMQMRLHLEGGGEPMDRQQQQEEEEDPSGAEDLSSTLNRYELERDAIKVEADELSGMCEDLTKRRLSPPDDLLAAAVQQQQPPDEDDEDDDDLPAMSLAAQHEHSINQFLLRHQMSVAQHRGDLGMHSLDLSLPRSTAHLLEHLARTASASHAMDAHMAPPRPTSSSPEDVGGGACPESPPSRGSTSASLHLGQRAFMGMEPLPRPMPHRLDHLSHGMEQHLARSPPLQPQDMEPASPQALLEHLSRAAAQPPPSYVVDHLARPCAPPPHAMDYGGRGGAMPMDNLSRATAGHGMEFLARLSPLPRTHRLEAMARGFGYSMEHADAYLMGGGGAYATAEQRATPHSLDLTTGRAADSPQSQHDGRAVASPPPSSSYQECSPSTPSSSSSSYQAAATPAAAAPHQPPASPGPAAPAHSNYPTYLEFY